MFPWFQIALALVVASLLYYVISLVSKQAQKNKRQPPICSGWVPWLGCAVQFGKNPLMFIEEMRKKLGPVYTLKVAGERMTFLTEPSDFHHLLRSSNVDFQEAVKSSVQRIASLPEYSINNNHTKMHDTVKGRLSPSNLPAIYGNLYTEFDRQLSDLFSQSDGKNNPKEGDLHLLVRSSMYKSVINILFGKGVLPTNDEVKFKELEEKFVIFDEQFELGAKLPELFIREWSASKKYLMSVITGAVSSCMSNMPSDISDQTFAQCIMSACREREFVPNWCMMFMWAALANAIPITFWTLAFIYSHPEILAKVKAEVDPELDACDTISESTLTNMPYTKQCVYEAIRLRSPGIITRRVIQEFTVKGYSVPPGDMLVLSPFWAHRNPETFPDPDTFKPERWAKIDKNSLPEEFVAFGGGRYQCPGRWFALGEIHMYVSMFVNRFDCQMLNKVPDLCPLHVVGTQRPVQTCPVRLSMRSSR